MDRLAKEFIPPIEREDIITLSQYLDDLTDRFEDVSAADLYESCDQGRPAAVEMTDVIIPLLRGEKELLEEFADFKRSKKLKEQIIRSTSWRRSQTALYVQHERTAHSVCGPLHIIAWREIYGYLEHCA